MFVCVSLSRRVVALVRGAGGGRERGCDLSEIATSRLAPGHSYAVFRSCSTIMQGVIQHDGSKLASCAPMAVTVAARSAWAAAGSARAGTLAARVKRQVPCRAARATAAAGGEAASTAARVAATATAAAGWAAASAAARVPYRAARAAPREAAATAAAALGTAAVGLAAAATGGSVGWAARA